MATFICKNGTLIISDSLVFSDGSWEITNVSFEPTATTDSYAKMGDDWQITLSAFLSGTFTWDTKLDTVEGIDLDATIGETHVLLFDTVDGQSYGGEVVITNISINAGRGTVASVTWSAESNLDLFENPST